VKFATGIIHQALIDALGEAAVFKLLAGETPANCEADDPPGAVLVELELEPEPFEKSDGNLTAHLIGKGTEAAGRGKLARCFRFYNEDGVCIVQGSVCCAGEDGDLKMDNPSIAAGQKFAANFKLD
jgi:hypothetical protein